MKTLSILIGNSDDKLKQSEWNEFVVKFRVEILRVCDTMHFFGGPTNYERWQNINSVFTISEEKISNFKENIRFLGNQYKQDSIAIIQGDTELLSCI
jgi:hypothetical protein